MLRALHLYLQVAIFQPELRELRFSSRSCRSTLRVLRLYLKAAIFKPELPRTGGESSPRLRDCESRRANHETTSKGSFASNKIARRQCFDTHDLCRGFAETKKNSHSATARALRHARSPQRVHPRMSKTQKTSSFCTSTTPTSAEGSSGNVKNAENLEFLHLATRISEEGRAGISKNTKKLELLHLDHADPRRGFIRAPQKRTKPRVFAPRPRRSPQRVPRAPTKTQKSLSFCTSTMPIPAEGRIPDRRQHPHPPP